MTFGNVANRISDYSTPNDPYFSGGDPNKNAPKLNGSLSRGAQTNLRGLMEGLSSTVGKSLPGGQGIIGGDNVPFVPAGPAGTDTLLAGGSPRVNNSNGSSGRRGTTADIGGSDTFPVANWGSSYDTPNDPYFSGGDPNKNAPKLRGTLNANAQTNLRGLMEGLSSTVGKSLPGGQGIIGGDNIPFVPAGPAGTDTLLA
jgi:hypothetical protein